MRCATRTAPTVTFKLIPPSILNKPKLEKSAMAHGAHTPVPDDPTRLLPWRCKECVKNDQFAAINGSAGVPAAAGGLPGADEGA